MPRSRARLEHRPSSCRTPAELGVAPGNASGMAPCSAFSAFLAALKHGGATADAGLRQLRFAALYCPTILSEAGGPARDARHPAVAGGARRPRPVRLGSGRRRDRPRPALVRPPAGGMVSTVDGNSGPDDLWVILRERPLNLVRAFVRDSWSSGGPECRRAATTASTKPLPHVTATKGLAASSAAVSRRCGGRSGASARASP